MVSLKQSAIQLFSRLRFGGQMSAVPLADRSVPTQSFNQAAQQPAAAALVFLPGFSSVPQMSAPGVLADAAAEAKMDFVRFTHPDLLNEFSRLTYPRMIEDAVQVISALPHQNIVLVGSSFGAGMLRFVADQVDRVQPGRVTGMFAMNAVPPEALYELFYKQPGWSSFAARTSNTLELSSETLSQAVTLTREQIKSVDAYRNRPTRPFTGAVHLMCGKHDPVARTTDSSLMGRQLSADSSYTMEILRADHKLPANKIKTSLSRFLSHC